MKRFWDKTHRVGNCLEWQGALDTNGYGAFKLDGKKLNTNRVAWLLTYGDIPVGVDVCHTCDNRKCVEPSHLWLGTRQDNMKDCFQKGRSGGFIKKYYAFVVE